MGLGRRDARTSTTRWRPTSATRRSTRNGKVYGVDFTGDSLVWVDPVEHTSGKIPIPVLTPGAPSYIPAEDHGAVAVLGRGGDLEEHRPPAQPDDGPAAARLDDGSRPAAAEPRVLQRRRSATPFGEVLPDGAEQPAGGGLRSADAEDDAGRHLLSTHHLQFAEDKDNTLYFSGDTNVIGWINTRIWDETGDAAKAQGWCPLIVDTNGDGKIGAYTQPNEKPDPTQGHARRRLRLRHHREPDGRIDLVARTPACPAGSAVSSSGATRR